MTGTSPRLPSAIDQQARLASRGANLFQRRPAGRAQALEAGELRLDRDAGRAGLLDQPAAVVGDRGGRRLGGRCLGAASGPVPGQLGRVGVEAEADLTAALFDERREPIREMAQLVAQPLTLVFSAEPAEKRGTLPPGMVILSPVRGLTP